MPNAGPALLPIDGFGFNVERVIINNLLCLLR